jgi:lipid II:glycine glycyltransferase (peptidoglycan interpeptide bridge formation enzyme)
MSAVARGGSEARGDAPGATGLGAAAPGCTAARLAENDAGWDAFVAATRLAPYLQTTPWAMVKARNGWTRVPVIVDAPGGAFGAQVLTHRIGPSRWSVAYAPRGPVGVDPSADSITAWTQAVRTFARSAGVSHVVIDPEIESGGSELDWFVRSGWRPVDSPQPVRSRWIDLAQAEDAMWGALRGKWRQYVQKARRNGIAIVEGGVDDLPAFHAIYVDTAERAGFTHRTEETYRAVYDAFAAHGRARLLFARDGAGTPVAALMLVGWGHRVVEPYGGMTTAGAETRANYLLKWEAIRTSRERGYQLYDLWGLSHAGIEHFKAGFGGREVRFIGGLELVVRPVVRAVVESLQALRVRRERSRVERLARRRAGPDLDGTGAGSGAETTHDPGGTTVSAD